VRTLSPEVFDLILKYLHLSLLDLAPLHEIEAQLERRRTRERVAEIAFLDAPIGPGHSWPTGLNWRKTFPAPFLSIPAPAELAMVRFAADPQMIGTLSSYDVALLDIAEQGPFSPQGLYVVERNGEAVMRYIRSGAQRHYLITDAELNNPNAWEVLRLSPLEFRALVKARVIWLGREQDRDALAQRGRFL
jgi:hypothetical protein